jgi:hypothetical protein
MKGLIIVTIIILSTTACYRDNWRDKYSGNEYREVTPKIIKIVQDGQKQDKQDLPKSD